MQLQKVVVVADFDEDVDELEPGMPITSPCDSVKVSFFFNAKDTHLLRIG